MFNKWTITKVMAIIGAFTTAAVTPLSAQSGTHVDLRSQAKNVDFSQASSTKPAKVGTALPSSCSLGDIFFKADAPAGANLYGCTATNIWALMSSVSGGSGGSGQTYTPGLGLSLSGAAFAADMSVLAGLSTSNSYSNLNDFSLGQIRVQTSVGVPSAPACSSSSNVGKLYARQAAQAANSTLYVCTETAPAAYAWELAQGASGGGGSRVELRIPLAWNYPGQGVFAANNVYSPALVHSYGNIGTPGVAAAIFFALSDTVTVAAPIPSTSWSGSVKLIGRTTTGQGGSGTIVFDVATGCTGDGVSSTTSYNAAQSWTLNVVTGQWKYGSLSLTTTGCSAGSTMYIKLVKTGGTYADDVFIPDVAVEM